MARRLGGVLTLLINGNAFPVRGSWEYTPTKTEKDGVAGQDEVHGYTEKPRVPGMKGDVSDFGEISIQALQQADIAVGQLNLANGKVIIGRDGWVKGEIASNTEDGKYPLELQFKVVFEQTAG
jgi:hypothetical protein